MSSTSTQPDATALSEESAAAATGAVPPPSLRAGPLVLRERGGRCKHYLLDRPLNGGDTVALCFSGGWVTGRYEWQGDGGACFHFSVELGGGRVWESSFELPEGALLRWP